MEILYRETSMSLVLSFLREGTVDSYLRARWADSLYWAKAWRLRY